MQIFQQVLSDQCHHYQLEDLGQRVSYGTLIENLVGNKAFQHRLIESLAASSFTAFRFETPPVTHDSLDQPFEFVLLNAPHLVTTQDPNAFMEYFRNAPEADAVTFSNLGGDAELIVPTPRIDDPVYGHLADFVRGAPLEQQLAFFKILGETLQKNVNSKPLWMNTEGSGVPWLHVRLDRTPKYYDYAPYRLFD